MPWQVLIVEDDPDTRAFFARSVAQCAQLRLIDAVESVAAAQQVLGERGGQVDVLLVDLGLPDGSGLDVIRKALALNPTLEPLVVSMFGDEENVLAAIEAGALGYIHKDSTPDDVAQVILDMRAGASPISPMIARRVLTKYRNPKQKRPSALDPVGFDAINVVANREMDETSLPISPREQEVLELIARGFSYAEISRLQDLSVHTVQTHVKRLYAKLSVHSKTEAVFEASRLGLLCGVKR